MQRHDALDDDDGLRLHVDGFLLAVALYIRIGGLLNGLAILQHLDVLGQQLPVEGIGMVEVDGSALLGCQVRGVIIIRIEGNDRRTVWRQCLRDFPHDGGLARASATSYSNDCHNSFRYLNTF